MKETWKSFRSGYYQVSNFGRVRSVRSGKLLTLLKSSNGYVQVSTSVRNEPKKHLVHQLVAENFIGPCPRRHEVNHKDLDKSNNCDWNLEYKTHAENIAHAHKNGIKFGWLSGEKNVNGKLTIEDVKEIRMLESSGHNRKEIAKRFNVIVPTISRIVNYKRRTA